MADRESRVQRAEEHCAALEMEVQHRAEKAQRDVRRYKAWYQRNVPETSPTSKTAPTSKSSPTCKKTSPILSQENLFCKWDTIGPSAVWR